MRRVPALAALAALALVACAGDPPGPYQAVAGTST